MILTSLVVATLLSGGTSSGPSAILSFGPSNSSAVAEAQASKPQDSNSQGTPATGSGQGEVPAAVEKPSDTLSRMVAYYATSPAIQGRWVFTQSAADKSLTINTDFAVQRPNKLYIKQVDSRDPNRPVLISSNGSEYSYEAPSFDGDRAPVRLVEPVVDDRGIKDLAQILGSAKSTLKDQFSPMLALSVAHKPTLLLLYGSWKSVEAGAPETIRGVACKTVGGKYRQNAAASETGRYKAWIGPSGELLRYITEERFSATDPATKRQVSVNVVSKWDFEVKIDADIPASTFTLIR